ncbi:MAG: sensor histidine kinase [Phycisphaeraceae bacterium]
MTLFFLGIAIGVLLAIPGAWLYSRRTERLVRVLERRARQSERLAEQATMTRGLAHEIKNPLSTIGLNVQLLQEDASDIERAAEGQTEIAEQAGKMRRRLGTLGREAVRLREILEDFLRFAGRIELDKQPTDLNALVDELAVFFEPQAHEAGINLRTQLDPQLPKATADPSLLKQATLNLMINATHAMADAKRDHAANGGANELILRTSRATTKAGDRLRIHVIDTGPGMSDEVKAQVFKPYFSTKRTGTGLGLPTTRRIVEEHGGELALHTEPGRGSAFTIELPA